MAKYVKCPTCGNSEKNAQLSQCKCGKIFCIKLDFIGGSGCGYHACPGCGIKSQSDRKSKRIGMITS